MLVCEFLITLGTGETDKGSWDRGRDSPRQEGALAPGATGDGETLWGSGT